MSAQEKIASVPEPEENGVMYAVITNYEGPHPHVEGVFWDRESAVELHKRCGEMFSDPHPLAWSLWELEPGKEPKQISP